MVKSILIAALILGTDGFAVNRPPATGRTVMSMTSNGDQSSSRREFAASAFGLTAAVLAGNASPAFAEAIKTFDMSMPSYDKASKPKAGVDAVDGINPSSSEGKLGISKGGGGGGASMGYSGGGGSKKEKARKEAKAKEDQEKAEEKKAEMMGMKIMNMEMPSYGSETSAKEKSMFKL